MTLFGFNWRSRKRKAEQIEREKFEKLEKAEAELLELQSRAETAISALNDRRTRNHWREAIERMVQGV